MTELTAVDGITEKTQNHFEDSGFRTAEDIASANPEELTDVKYVAEKRAASLIESAREAVDVSSDEYDYNYYYDPLEEEIVLGEPEKWFCQYCDKPFQAEAVWKMHENNCPQSSD